MHIIEIIIRVISTSGLWDVWINFRNQNSAIIPVDSQTLKRSLGLSHNIFDLETSFQFPELVLIAFILVMWVVLVAVPKEANTGLALFIVSVYLVVLIAIEGYLARITSSFRVSVFEDALSVSSSSYALKYTVLYGSLVTLLAMLIIYILNNQKETYMTVFTLTAVLTPFFMLLQSCAHLVSIFVTVEIIAVILYTITVHRITRGAIDSATKYFVQGGISSGLFINSIIFLLISFGTGVVTEIYEKLRVGEADSITIFAINYFILALIFKLVSFPGYLWASAVYANVPYTVLLVFTVISKFSFVSFFLTIYWELVSQTTEVSYSPLIVIVVIVSLIAGIIGTLEAIRTSDLKQFIVYTGINQIGFILMPSIFFIKSENLAVSLYYTSIYLVGNFVFIFALVVISALQSNDTVDLVSLRGLQKFVIHSKQLMNVNIPVSILNLFFVYVILIAVWSIAGLPPFGGFYTKVTIWRSFYDDIALCLNPTKKFINNETIDLVVLGDFLGSVLLLSFVSSVVSLYYYFELFRPVLASESRAGITPCFTDTHRQGDVDVSLLIWIATLIIAVLLLLFMPIVAMPEDGWLHVPRCMWDFVPAWVV